MTSKAEAGHALKSDTPKPVWIRSEYEGHNGPFYSPGLEKLQHAYDERPHSRAWLDQAAGLVTGFDLKKVASYPKTRDKYEWETGYSVEMVNEGHIVILLPKKNANGESDRHCVIYTQKLGGNSLEGMFHLLTLRLADAIRG